MPKLRTWIISYADGVQQAVDAFTKSGARQQATHGAPIMGIRPATL